MASLESSELNQLFTVGSEVEVSSDEEGFKGSWYRATILEPPVPKKHKQARVEYKTLLAEDGSEQLKENVHYSYIRPLPSEEEEGDKDFDEGEVVGAYCRDGWWTGVVKRVLKDNKYRIFFDNPPDVIEFERKELRVHQEWLDGKWVRPEKQQKSGSIFSSGADVQVNIKEKYLHDAWFSAIVIKENGDNTFFVKYQSSNNGDDTGFQKRTVDFVHIRPSPPPHADRSYDLLDKVEAFCDFGWQAGLITKVLTDGRYAVYFKHGNEVMELSKSAIRPRMEWKDGKWVGGSKEVVLALDDQEQLGHAGNYTGNSEAAVQLESSGTAKDNTEEKTPYSVNSVKSLMDPLSPCDGNTASYASTPSLKKIRLRAPVDNGTHSRPSKKLKEENATEVPLSVTASKLGKVRSKMSTKVLLATPNRGGKGTRCSGVGGNQPSAKTKSLVVGRKVRTKQQNLGELDGRRTDPVNKKGRRTKSQINSPVTSETGKEGNGGGCAAEEIVEEEGIRREVEMPVILGLEAKMMGRSEAGSPSQFTNEEFLKQKRDRKKTTNDPKEDKSMDIDQQKSGGSINKRKRGRPRKLIISSEDSEIGKEQNGARSVTDKTAVKDHPTNEVALHVLSGSKPTDSEDVSRKKLAEVSVTDSMTNEVGTAKAGASENMDDDDQPLSTWFGGMQTPPSMDESRLCPGRNEDQQVDIVQQSPATDATCDGILDDNRSLPFVKSSPLWKTVESMEIFKTMPQNPHFHPLSNYIDPYREGLAIGSMVTFSGLVEKIPKLQCDDPRSTFDSYLESLNDLEMHGFNVTVLQGRVKELQSIKDKHGQILDKSNDAGRKIVQYNHEKTKFAEELDEIAKKIIELQEKHASIKSEMETKDLDIGRLEKYVDTINDEVHSTQLDFEKVATAPWNLA